MQDHPITVRRLDESDIGLACRTLTEVNGRSVDDAATKEFLRDPSCYLLVAEINGNVVGALNGYALRRPYRSEHQFLLYEVNVSPSKQNQGIGKKLVSAFIDEARRRGAFEVWVLTDRSNGAARKMYAQCGMSAENPDAQDVMMNLMIETG